MAGRGYARGRWRWLTAPFDPRRQWLAGFALWGFFTLSVIATGLGFADLRMANTGADHLSIPEFVVTLAATLFVVSAMVVALHHALAGSPVWLRPVSLAFYLFFAVWSVGFGYGFFWKEMAGQEATERNFQSAIAGLGDALARAGQALETAEQSTAAAAGLAAARARTEAEEGRTCANRPASTPGDGPLTRSRFAFADRARTLSDDVRINWTAPIARQRAQLERRVAALSSRRVPAGATSAGPAEAALLERLASAQTLPTAERRVLFLSVHEEARQFAEAANGLRALHAASVAARLDTLAADVGADPLRPGSADPARANDPGYCWDVVLGEQLASASAQLRGLEDVAAPEFVFLEGPQATRAAVFALAGWIGQLVNDPSDNPARQPFGEREFLALFASLAVDLGILFLTIIRSAPAPRQKPGKTPQGQGLLTRPRLSQILDD